jgi:hypothetical protein
MSAARQRNPGQSNSYEHARLTLERETAALIAERRQLEGGFDTKSEKRVAGRPLYAESAAITPVVLDKNQANVKAEEVVSRIQEIIKLCKVDGTLREDEMAEILKMETAVLGYLQRNNSSESEPNVVRPSQESPVPNQKSRVEANQTWGKEPQDRTKMGLSEDTLEMISQIERKALGEIIHLQRERDALKQEKEQLQAELQKSRVDPNRAAANESNRLREENRLLREENEELRIRLNTYEGSGIVKEHYDSSAQNDYVKENLAHGQYDSQIAVYENELRRASAVISELKRKLSNVPGIEDLHDQGERIRRETTELLQRTGGRSNEAALLQRLEE